MSNLFTTQINEVDRKTQKSFSGKSVETAGPLALLQVNPLLSVPAYDDFTTTNPFAQNEAQFQPQQAQTEAPQQPVWVPRTVGEMTSGLYDQNGNIKNIQYVA